LSGGLSEDEKRETSKNIRTKFIKKEKKLFRQDAEFRDAEEGMISQDKKRGGCTDSQDHVVGFYEERADVS